MEGLMIGNQLDIESKDKIKQLLRKNKDLFGWDLEDVQGVRRDLMEHQTQMPSQLNKN